MYLIRQQTRTGVLRLTSETQLDDVDELRMTRTKGLEECATDGLNVTQKINRFFFS